MFRRMFKRFGGTGRKKRILMISLTLILCFMVMNGSAILPAIKALWEMKKFIEEVFRAVSDIIVRLLYSYVLKLAVFDRLQDNYDHFPETLLLNPQLLDESGGEFTGKTTVENLVNFSIRMTQPFYMLAIVLIAFYLLFVSGSPLGRARAKSSLIKLVISMGFILLTVPIMQLFLDISECLTGNILNLVDVKQGTDALKDAISALYWQFQLTVALSFWNAMYLLLFAGIMFFSVLLLLAMRYFLIIFFTILFPLTVFFFAFYFTRRIGAQLFKQSLSWIFIQPLMAFLLVAISVAAQSMPMMDDPAVSVSFGLAGFLALLVSPLIVTNIMDWLAMLMIMLTAIEFPGLHGLIGMVDELQIEGPETEEYTPPPPIRPPRIPANR